MLLSRDVYHRRPGKVRALNPGKVKALKERFLAMAILRDGDTHGTPPDGPDASAHRCTAAFFNLTACAVGVVGSHFQLGALEVLQGPPYLSASSERCWRSAGCDIRHGSIRRSQCRSCRTRSASPPGRVGVSAVPHGPGREHAATTRAIAARVE